MTRKVLAVDDSSTMREMLSITLKGAGFDVIKAQDGQDALSMIRPDVKYDLIITDLNMPVMDGFELIGNLRRQEAYKYTPILVLTTESDAAKKERGKMAGATGWILKPFNPEKLLEVVNKVCP